MNSSHESPNLDFLRSIAVILVLIRHLMSACNYSGNAFIHPQMVGILGVLFFFVHTTLVLMFSLQRQIQKNGLNGYYFSFLLRRACRIYPLSIFVVVSLYLINLWSSSHPAPQWMSIFASHDLSARFFLSNLLLIQNITGVPSSMASLWTLPLEVQMYLILPFLFLFWQKYRSFKKLVMLYLGFVVLATIIYFLKPLREPLSMFLFAPCFFSGLICYAVNQRLAPSRQKWSFWCLPALLTVLFFIYMQTGNKSQTFGGYPVCLMLGCALPFIADVPGKFIQQLCHLIARYSYGIYLFHPIFIGLIFSPYVTLSVPLRILLVLVSTGIVSVAGYYAIEAPMIRAGNDIVRRMGTGTKVPAQNNNRPDGFA